MAARRGDKQARRRDILDAAGVLLRENGLAGLQMREVARRAGIALGTVYTYFTTKESLHGALYAERMEEFLADLRSVTAAETDPEDMFVRFATGYRRMYADFGREFQLLTSLTAQTSIDPPVLEQLIKATAGLMQVMRSALAEYRIEEPDKALIVMWSTITGLAEHFTGPRQAFHGLSWDDTVRFAAQSLLRGLLPVTVGHDPADP